MGTPRMVVYLEILPWMEKQKKKNIWHQTHFTSSRCKTQFHTLLNFLCITFISVAFAIGPSVTTSSIDFSFENLVF